MKTMLCIFLSALPLTCLSAEKITIPDVQKIRSGLSSLQFTSFLPFIKTLAGQQRTEAEIRNYIQESKKEYQRLNSSFPHTFEEELFLILTGQTTEAKKRCMSLRGAINDEASVDNE